MIDEIKKDMGFTEDQAKFCDMLTDMSYKAGWKAAMDGVGKVITLPSGNCKDLIEVALGMMWRIEGEWCEDFTKDSDLAKAILKADPAVQVEERTGDYNRGVVLKVVWPDEKE